MYFKVLWRWLGWRNIEMGRVYEGSVAMVWLEDYGGEMCI